jgi:hypothetical protein
MGAYTIILFGCNRTLRTRDVFIHERQRRNDNFLVDVQQRQMGVFARYHLGHKTQMHEDCNPLLESSDGNFLVDVEQWRMGLHLNSFLGHKTQMHEDCDSLVGAGVDNSLVDAQ